MNLSHGKKLPVRMTRGWVYEMIAMIESTYDLDADWNQDAIDFLKYLKKRLEDF